MTAEPKSDHRSTPLAPRDAERQLTLRTVAALVFTASAIFWLLFAVAQFLVIDIADSVGNLDAGSERASGAGVALVGLNLLAIGLTTGLLGRGSFARFLTEALLVALIAVSLLLYPSPAVWRGPLRLAVHAADILALVLAIAANYLPRKPEA